MLLNLKKQRVYVSSKINHNTKFHQHIQDYAIMARIKFVRKLIPSVGKNKYICVESYRNEVEKTNLLYWQVTCESFYTPDEWRWWFNKYNYNGDYSFIYFE